MFFRIAVISLIVIPVIEIWGILQVGKWIGPLPTILTLIATSVLGGYLAKRQGTEVIRLAQLQIGRGQLPGEAILDGACILAGGVLLLTPGFFTDIVGFFLVIPFTRGLLKLWLRNWLDKLIRDGKVITIRRY